VIKLSLDGESFLFFYFSKNQKTTYFLRVFDDFSVFFAHFKEFLFFFG